eukprot:Blabericola_migrator_1__808@NODE_11_length_24785_cov_110_100736_g8_i0_p4_GENE_NODE_11_length_24785_cov_110_100736_g8_i0NODE_11_length_24785_cov_110_100736_g8_i0_p4_ORF_typecomplete_len590_score68_74_NODE_11_length_24785_cov_110_100736_g8_i01439416163
MSVLDPDADTSCSHLSDHEIADTGTLVTSFIPPSDNISDPAAVGDTGGTEQEDESAEEECDASPVTVSVRGIPVIIPSKLLKSPAFQHSYLALLLKGLTPQGVKVTLDEKGDIYIDSSKPSVFQMLIDHLCDKNPLMNLPFETVTQAYEDLLGEVIQWRLPRTNILLPPRLWTNRRWTDLTAWYSLTPHQRVLLAPQPVAVQLTEEEYPTPILTSRYLSVSECMQFAEREMISDLISEGEAEIIAGYEIESFYCLIAKELKGPIEGGSTGDQNADATLVLYMKVPNELLKSDDPSAAYGAEQHRILTHSLPSDFRIPAPPIRVNNSQLTAEFPYMYRKPNKLYWWFSVSFGLEIAFALEDGFTRIKINRMAAREKQAPQVATPLASGWLGVPRSSGNKGREDWMCYHPDLAPAARYTSACRLTKEMPFSSFQVRRLKFYPWGALVVADNMSPLIAVLCIDEPDMRRIYGDRVTVSFKSGCVLVRSELDVAVAPDLSRVYLCLYGTLISQSISPISNKIIFEVPSAPPRTKVKPGQIHVPEGSPTGPALGDLSCLGVLADFNPATGLYYQAEISRLLCPRFARMRESGKG